MTPEGRVKAKTRRLLRPYVERGEVYEFMPVQTGFGKKTLDWLGCIRGRFVAIEFKKPGGVPTALQEVHIAQIRRAGGRVFVVSGDTAELERYLASAAAEDRPAANSERLPKAA